MKETKLHAKNLLIIFLVLFVLLSTSCQSIPKATAGSDTLYQVSLLNALMLGEYDGFVPVSVLQTKGNIGIGTFDTLDGEMIFLDGIMYRATATGAVELVGPQEMIPFAVVKRFTIDLREDEIGSLENMDIIKDFLDQQISKLGNDLNCFYVAKLEGDFFHVKVRSVPPQEKPYKRLSEIAATQKEFNYENLEGTIVAFRCPEYVAGINLPQWHLHFLSSDKTKGGHLLEANLNSGSLEMDLTREFDLILPQSESFAHMDIAHDLSKETSQVEGK
ncbi:acetolactate decarboxylase [uncultured Sphaerochaeta sp.]|uniref:acetolactate decarboxylase n=1 Tax=uncultured Sphaerochaeta sp. TaxID=886478 RepID=UPI002A0A7AC6|nr:acetolactate decarboxylase [uncultured Sphaerochaeta sp.]